MKLKAVIFGLGALATSALAGGIEGSGLIVLDPSASGALEMVGNATIHIPARAVYVNSNHSTAVRTTGNAMLDAPQLLVVGGTSFGGHSGCSGQVTRTGVPFSDPLSIVRIPSAAGMSGYPAMSITSNTTLSPGYYAGGVSISGNANVTMLPGVYLFGGTGFRLTSGSVSGQGVGIVILAGKMSFAGNGNVNITAPTSGDMSGVVVAQPASNHNALSLAGGSNMTFRGAIYAPGATISLVGNSQAQGDGPQMGDIVVANRVSIAGTGSVRIGQGDSQTLVPPKLPMAD
jgi:hypothetical protein